MTLHMITHQAMESLRRKLMDSIRAIDPAMVTVVDVVLPRKSSRNDPPRGTPPPPSPLPPLFSLQIARLQPPSIGPAPSSSPFKTQISSDLSQNLNPPISPQITTLISLD
ncbi:hypothetical protein Droror1_Dr00011573 [Drosera rotundifolia]